jgi:hypothetical protein
MKTIREEAFGNVRLRILETGDSYTGIVISNGKVSDPIEGDDPDELWAQLRRLSVQKTLMTGTLAISDQMAQPSLWAYPAGPWAHSR